MSAGLINHLKQKTEADSNTKILMSQWEFDEKLVGKSLENVGSYYPHFSSHNESHSKQILVNIERLLGSNINKLTATDTWLILEAAYWHDIGMLFSADEAKAVYEKAEFKDYVESLAMDNTQDLHDFAKVWHEQGWQKAMVSYIDPYTGVEKYRQMIAEWYRRGHAKNSNDIVLDPFSKLNLNSPRTELLPKRIYRYLGAICWAHGRGFDYVMEHLPFRQTGMGTENCHPRFVACLLRLGDLFDIDDNRFCPVMKKQVSNIPALSTTHEEKHKAIREFQLDSETVSVTAECSTEMAYIECRNWFNWIEEELQKQMSQWKNIVPHRDFGLLPTINKLDVQMEGKKILLNDKPMKFSLDERSAIELLQGNNLYKDDMSIYRELIQNAIDATMIRVWLEHGQKKSQESLPLNANPYDEDTRKLFKKYPIELDCRKIADNDDSTLWEFSIEDHGIGISRKDLEYMQKIAGSKNNKEKQKIIHQMPEWMRPSGEFGIGIHSAFLLMKNLPIEKQKIIIFTKSLITHEGLKIELNSPLSGKSGYCFIEENKKLNHYGTKLIINIIIRKNKVFENNELSENKFEDIIFYDYKSSELQALNKVLSIYRNMNNNTVCLKINSNLIFEKNKLKTNNKPIVLNRSNMYWDNENQSAIKPLLLEYGETYDRKSLTRFIRYNNYRKRIFTFYKGQALRYTSMRSINYFAKQSNNPLLMDNPFSMIIDIYTSNAKEIVTLSRDEVKNVYTVENKFISSYEKLLYSIKNENYDSIQLFDNNIRKKSMFLKLNNLDTDDSWKDFRISDKYTVNDILNKEKITNYDLENKEYLELEGKELIEILKSKIFENLLASKIFRKILNDIGFNIYYTQKNNSSEFLISKEKIESDLFHKSNEFEKINPQESILENPKFNIDDILQAYTYRLEKSKKHIDYKEYLTQKILPIDKIKENLSSEIENDILFKNIKIEINKKYFIIFPFLVINNTIIEISNKKLYEISSGIQSSKFEDYDEGYSILKDTIISYARDKYPKWYESYLVGKSFTPIDLTRLNKIYEPSSK